MAQYQVMGKAATAQGAASGGAGAMESKDGDDEDEDQDETMLRGRLDLAHTALTALDATGLVRYDRRTGALLPTALGRVASYYYVSHTSIATYH